MKTNMFKSKLTGNNRGSAILIVLALIAMLTGISLMSVDRSNTDMELSYNQLHEERAFYIAEAGMERALTDINSNYAWRTGYANQKMEDGYYTVTLVDKTTNPLLADTVVAQASGSVFNSTSKVEVWLAQGRKYPFRSAAFGDELLFMQNEGCTDSYASDSGTYAATQSNFGGDVGSNEKIWIKDNVVVGGNMSTATGGTITVTSPASYTGSTSTTSDPQTMDLVSDADYAYAQANNSAPAGFTGTGYSYSSGNLEIQDYKTVTLSSGIYYFKNLHLKNQAQLQLAPGANVQIFITGDFMVENDAQLNSTGVPAQCAIFTKGTNVDFKNGATIKASVYAPNCDFMHQNDADLYGSIMAKSVEIKNDGCIHFDRALLRSGYYIPGDFEIIAWRQTD